MGQLKPSEVRLLILFLLTVLVLGSFFLYEWYARALADVNSEKVNLLAERTALRTMEGEQDEYNRKRVWLNRYQPVARDEFEAKEALDRVVSVQGISAAGLTLVSAPPESDPSLEPHYWAFERRVIVRGNIQNIVQWLASLQSETAFRSVTSLHIFPKKKKEPEELTCEITIEQRYATEDIINMSNVVLAAAPSAGSNPQPATETPGTPSAATEPAPEGGAPASATSTPGVTRRVVSPAANEASTAPEEASDGKRRVILPPGPGATPPSTSPAGGAPATNDAGASVGSEASSGLLATSTRGRATGGLVPPPPMPVDIAREEINAAREGRDPRPIQTGMDTSDPSEMASGFVPGEPLPPKTIPIVDEQTPSAPGPRTTYDSVRVGGVVGEHWDANTPGATGANDPDVEASLQSNAQVAPTN